jgi:hypothetical protein
VLLEICKEIVPKVYPTLLGFPHNLVQNGDIFSIFAGHTTNDTDKYFEREVIDMYQQQTPQPRDERERSGIDNEYEAGGYQQSDRLADAVARRLQAQASPVLQVPSFSRNPFIISAAQRLALAIISVVVLVPLAGIALGVLKGEGLIVMGIIGAIILGINITFNNHQ